MNTLTTHRNNLKALALIYGVSAAAILTIATILLIACFYSRRRIFPPPPPHHDGASVSSDEESVAIEAGLNQEIVKSYPKIIYRQFKIENGDLAVDSSSSCCSICLAEYSENDTLLLLPDCSHFFHFNCIDLWFKRHPTCPICRKSPPPAATGSAGDNQVAPFNLWFVPFRQ